MAQTLSIPQLGSAKLRKIQDMNQFAMWQVFCWSARVMCLCISPLPIQASRIGFASSPRAIASKFSSGLYSAIAQQSFESRFVVTLPVEPVPKIRCDCPEFAKGCGAFFCAACLLERGGGDEPRDGRLTKRKGVVPRVKKREDQDAARRLTSALERTRRGHLCRRGTVERDPSARDAGRD